MIKKNNSKKIKFVNYYKLRKIHYKTQTTTWKEIEITNWIKNPYTAFKSIFYIETSALIVYFSQFTNISPNQLTFVYIFFGAIGGLLLASDNSLLILISIFLIFTKGTFDWADGLLARIKNQTSNLGNLLDNWGAKVGSYSFFAGFGYYLYNKSNSEVFLLLIIFTIFLRAIDLKDYSYHLAMYEFTKQRDKKKFFQKLNFSKNLFSKKKFNLFKILKNFIQNYVDERARTIDLILLLILTDTFFYELIFLQYIFYYMSFKVIVIFFGGIYVTTRKKFLFK
tara:strand:- start:7648 stop:8490 length:843 start_codon:yes stop_codon:yes gene_type:complete